MRPNIDISHTLAGRVKDWKEANDIDDLSEAYTTLIQAGLIAMQTEDTDEEPVEEADGGWINQDRMCPDCGEIFDSIPELLEHVENTDPDHDT